MVRVMGCWSIGIVALCFCAWSLPGCQSGAKSGATDGMMYVDAVEAERLLGRARSEYETGNVATAESILREALAANPFDGRLHYNLGVIELASERIGSALQRFERAAELMPQAVEPQLGLASVWLAANEHAAAADALQRAIDLDPRHARAMEMLSEIRFGASSR